MILVQIKCLNFRDVTAYPPPHTPPSPPPPPRQKSCPGITSTEGVTKERLQRITVEGENMDD
jgi:hypothetical protein